MKVRLRMSNTVTKKVEVSENEHKDMLSDLPDCIILHILSFLSTKHAVRTFILSSRWKDLWKRLPALSFGYRDFRSADIFNEFVFKVLSLIPGLLEFKILSLIPGLLEFKIRSLGKLKSLKVEIDEIKYGLRLALCNVKLQNIMSKKEADGIEKEFDLGLEPSPLVPDGIVDFLLQNSPSAKVDFVDGRKQKPLRRGHL